jgi:hypothetical protein
MTSLLKSVSLILIFVGISGCATSTAPEKLARATVREQLVFTERITAISIRGAFKSRLEEGVLPGVFTAEREDANGVYFFADGRRVWNVNPVLRKTPHFQLGGIYIPRDPAGFPSLFTIFEREVHTADSVDAYVAQQSSVDQQSAQAPVGTGVGGIGVNALGSAIGGAILNGIVDAEVGKILLQPPMTDLVARQKILDARTPLP